MTAPTGPIQAPVEAPLEPLLVALQRGVTVDRQRTTAARAELLRQCRRRLWSAAPAWVAAAAAAKGDAGDAGVAAEEWGHGPLPVARQLLVLEQTLRHLARGRLPPLRRHPPGDGPTATALPRSLLDRALLPGYRAVVGCEPGPLQQAPPAGGQGIAVVLGAGNVSSMPVADALDAIAVRGRAVLLKLSPLHRDLLPILGGVLRPLIDAGLLALCCGDADLARAALRDPRTTAWHLTGAPATLAALRADPAIAAKAWTAETGNVTPVLVVPGAWAEADLDTAARQVAAWFAHNAACNCVTPRVLLCAAGWPQRPQFLERLRLALAAHPPRRPFHPGARARYRRFLGDAAPSADDDRLPFALRPGVDLDREPHLGLEESFAPVLVEVAVRGDSAAAFVDAAAGLARERLFGALAAHALAPPPVWRRAALPRDWPRRLPHALVAIDTWAAVGYAAMTVPWGNGDAAAGDTAGRGFAHGALCLRAPRQSVVHAPFRPWPAPPWLPVEDPRPLLQALCRGHAATGPASVLGAVLDAAVAAGRRGRLR